MIYHPGVLIRSIIEAAERRRIARPFGAYPAVLRVSRIKTANEMTTEETSIWIWTLGYNLGWLEAQDYAKSFKDNDIDGSMLPLLADRELRVDLEIQNRDHRMAIMREIDWCFPGANENHLKLQNVVGLGEQGQGRVGSIMDESTASNTTMRTGGVSVYDMSESVSSTDESLSVENQMSSSVPMTRCLVLTLCPEKKVALGSELHVKTLFAKFNFNVEVMRFKERDNSYLLVFHNEKTALKANAQFKNLDYQLSKYRPRRPSPGNSVLFKVLSPVTVRVGKSLKTKKVKMLEKNDIIRVNQQKGRRARVISSQNGGRVGWVSLHDGQGEPLLERCEHTRVRFISHVGQKI